MANGATVQLFSGGILGILGRLVSAKGTVVAEALPQRDRGEAEPVPGRPGRAETVEAAGLACGAVPTANLNGTILVDLPGGVARAIFVGGAGAAAPASVQHDEHD